MVIKGISGLFSGKEFEIKNPILIGRNSQSCSVVYPDNAAGVSRTHCKIETDGSNVTITDLGSSYGTYLNGSKLAAHKPMVLRPGDTFYLGDKSNSFTVLSASSVSSGASGHGSNASKSQKKGKSVVPMIIGGIAAVLVIVAVVIFALRGSSEADLVGTWEVVGNPGVRMSFAENGELIITDNGNFAINGSLTYSKAGDNMVSVKYTEPVTTTTDSGGVSIGLKIIGVNFGSETATTEAYANGCVWKYEYNPKIESMVVRDVNDVTLFVLARDSSAQ